MAKELNLKKIIGNNSHWTLNKAIVRQIGLTETLVLQHIIDLESVFNRDEIFQPIPKMAEELGISEWNVKQCIGKLKSAELIYVERKSVGFMNFYSVNQSKVLEFMSGSVNSPVSSNSTHQRVGHVSEVESNSQLDENQLTVSRNSTMGELNYISQRSENHSAITNNTTNNTLQTIDTKNTTAEAGVGNLKNITERILDVLIDADSKLDDYNSAIEDYNELGGVDGIAEILIWDDSVKEQWHKRIKNINLIKTTL
jgi:hypothetical protein